MRILLVGASALALSGCSWLGLGGHNPNHTYDNQSGYYYAQQPVKHNSCKSQQCLSRWNVEAAAGPGFIVGGKALTGDDINDNDGIATVNTVKMRNAFDDGYRAELGGSYALNPNRKVTVNGFYAKAKGADNVALGTLNGNDVTGSFSDYKSYGGELGLRQYMPIRQVPVLRSIRPYIEGKAGGAYVEDINIETAQGGNALFASGTRLYDGSWVPTAAGLIGLETPILRQMTVGLETGVRYTGKLEFDTTNLSAGTLAAGANNGSDRWTVPVMLRGRYRF